MSESVEEFLARGGKIKEVPFGVSGEKQLQGVRSRGRGDSRIKYVERGRDEFNPWAGDEEKKRGN